MGGTPVDPPGFQANRSDALPPGTQLEGYVIERVIGASGFGFVYLALDSADSRHVAIKEYLPDTLAVRDEDGVQVLVRADSHIEAFERGREAFIEEAQLLARCHHPSLLHVTRSWQSKGTAYRVMPYYPGHSLLSLREAMDAPPDEASLRALLDGLLGALETLHEAGVIHREVSPWNVLLLPDDTPVLLDFNAARRAMVGSRARALMSLLTPTFAPIELTDPTLDRPIGPWTDIHALGAVVKYCISGEMPRIANAASPSEPMGTLVRRLQADFPNLHYSASFLTAIDAALAPSPEDRPQSVDALRKRLDDHPAAATSSDDEAMEPDELESAEEAQPEAPEPSDAETSLASSKPSEAPSATSQAPFAPAPTRSAPAPTPFVAAPAPLAAGPAPFATAPTPFALRYRSADTENGEDFDTSARTGAPQTEDFAAHSDDRLVGLDFATRSRRKRRRAVMAGIVVSLAVVGTGSWWLNQQHNASATQSAFEQALKRDVGIKPAEPTSPPPDTAQPPARPAQPVPSPASQGPAALPEDSTRAVAAEAGSSVAPVPVGPAGLTTAQVTSAPTSTPTPTPAPATATEPVVATSTKQAPIATSTSGTEDATPLPPDPAATQKPAPSSNDGPAQKTAGSPRDACGARTEFSLYRCMKAQCAQAQWVQHPSCKRLRERDEVS